MQSLRSEYYVTHKDEAVTQSQAAYDIPARAVGMQLREVHLISSSGAIIDLPQISPEDVGSTAEGSPRAFYLKMNKVCLYPTPNATTGTLRLYYYLAPGSLVETTDAAQISTIDTGTGVVTFSSLPSAWSTADYFDFIRRTGGAEPLSIDQMASNVSSTTMTFASLPTGLAVGDWVALAAETPIPALPLELRPVLAQATAVRIGDSMQLPGLDSARKTLDEELKAASILLTPRVTGAPKKVVQRNGWIR